MTRDETGGLSLLAIATLIIILVITVGAIMSQLLYGSMLPTFLDQEREAVEHSQQYITTQQGRLQRLMTQYEDPEATEGQKRNILLEMYQIVDTIEEEHVPRSVQTFLDEHPRNP